MCRSQASPNRQRHGTVSPHVTISCRKHITPALHAALGRHRRANNAGVLLPDAQELARPTDPQDSVPASIVHARSQRCASDTGALYHRTERSGNRGGGRGIAKPCPRVVAGGQMASCVQWHLEAPLWQVRGRTTPRRLRARR